MHLKPMAVSLAKRSVAYLVLTAFTLVIAYPVIWVVVGSFKIGAEIYQNVWGLPATITWVNYVYAWTRAYIPDYILNSVIVSVSTVALVLALASAAAYSFSTFRFRGGYALYLLFVLLLIVPAPVSIIPLYVIESRLGLMDTYLALILPYTAGGLPLSIFIFKAFFDSIPTELRDAARIDGCTNLGAFLRVVLPVSTPALATVTILVFLGAWNEFFLALLFIRKPQLMTIPLGLQTFFYQYRVEWGYLFAALTMTVAPIIIVYLLMQRQFISGLTAGAVRG
jgi:raffinose/stachyose/melibiose transport system permease protein